MLGTGTIRAVARVGLPAADFPAATGVVLAVAVPAAAGPVAAGKLKVVP